MSKVRNIESARQSGDATLFASVFDGSQNPVAHWTGDLVASEIDEFFTQLNKEHRQDKKRLPLVKFAKFDRNRRLLNNILEVSAVQGDYDGGEMSVEEAEQAIRAAGLFAAINPSASWTAEKPKWHVYAPLSIPLSVSRYGSVSQLSEVYNEYLSWLNGILGGVLTVESGKTAQGFFAGRLKTGHQESHRVIRGQYLDKLENARESAVFVVPPNKVGKAEHRNEELLRWNTLLVDQHGESLPLWEWCSALRKGAIDSIRLKAPFREGSHSKDPAFLKLHDNIDRLPFIHDVGNSTTYELNSSDIYEYKVKVGDDINPIIPSHFTTIHESAQIIYPMLAATEKAFWYMKAVYGISEEMELEQITPQKLRSHIEHATGRKTMKFVQGANNTGRVLKVSNLSNDYATALLQSSVAPSRLPKVRVITKSPLMVNTDAGLVVTEPGYNHDVQVYVASDLEVEAVPFDEAVSSLMEVLQDFNFVSDGDLSRAVAMLITPELQAGSFFPDGTRFPMTMMEADKSQTGKTLFLQVRAAIYNDDYQFISISRGGVGSLDEGISNLFVKGYRFSNLDNVRGVIDSQVMEAAITNPNLVTCRIPHRGYVDTNISAISLGMTSNGVQLTRDQSNRVCIIRIRKQPKGYEFADYPEGDILNHVRKNSGYYLGCIHAVLKRWYDDGMPRNRGIGHDFRRWAGTVQHICQHYFELADPLKGHTSLQRRTSSPLQVWLRSVCHLVMKSGSANRFLAANELAEICIGSTEVHWPVTVPKEGQINQAIGRHMRKLFGGDELDVEAVVGSKFVIEEQQKIVLEEFEIFRSSVYDSKIEKKKFVYGFYKNEN